MLVSLVIVFIVVFIPCALAGVLAARDVLRYRVDPRPYEKPMQNRMDVEASIMTMGLGRRRQGWQEWSRRR